jgi:8-oxo-dGTP pyrophosphatase MutT (NUDIX family)
MHSVAMSAGVRNPRDSRFTAVRSPDRTRPISAEFVRLSHLRKLCECEQAAAVCYRVRGKGIEFLLVRTRGGGRWTFPKGSAEPGLTHAQAAALEAFEEAGVHGRIEEASFARYVRRERGGARKSAAKSGKKELAVYAHLCEVSRLSPPKESKRDRTWFSFEEAKRRLREGRKSDDGAEFVRVVDQAVARIQQLRSGAGIVDRVLEGRAAERRPQHHRPQQDRPQLDVLQEDVLQEDALQRVQFEAFVEAGGREASFLRRIRLQLSGIRQFAVPMVETQSPEVLRGEVLQFGAVREKKAKALGIGTKNG